MGPKIKRKGDKFHYTVVDDDKELFAGKPNDEFEVVDEYIGEETTIFYDDEGVQHVYVNAEPSTEDGGEDSKG